VARIEERKRADGGISYRVWWRLGGTRDGAPQTETFTTPERAASFKLDVEDAGQRWPQGWVKGYGYRQVDPSTPTLSDVANSYFDRQEQRVKLNKLTAYTLQRYRRNWELHLEPVLGDILFAELTDDDVANLVDELASDYSAKSIRNWHGTLFSIAQHGAVKKKLRPDNPCVGTDLPDPVDLKQVRFFQHGEWALFRANLKADVHLLVDLMLSTGMRWGEASALRWSDLAEGQDGTVVVHIERAWQARGEKDDAPIKDGVGETKKWKLGPPKGRKERWVVAPADVAARLAASAEGKRPSDYVFTTRYGNPWRHTDFHSDRWLPAAKAVQKTGLAKRFTPHMLRHTAVVWALAEGVKIEVVSEMLGHASIQITYDVYGGLVDKKTPEMAQAVARGMLLAQQSIVPLPSPEEVEARVIRPGLRGESRRRAS